MSGLCQTIRNQDGCPDHHADQDDPDEGEDAGADQGRPSSSSKGKWLRIATEMAARSPGLVSVKLRHLARSLLLLK